MVLEHVLDIAAPPERVWAVTLDIERWPTWTPTMTRVTRLDEGPLAVGSVAAIDQPGLPRSRWEVTELEEERRFAWRTRSPGIAMVATHALEPIEGGTRNRLRVDASGPLATLFGPVLRQRGLRMLARENAGLKARCETGGSDAARGAEAPEEA